MQKATLPGNIIPWKHCFELRKILYLVLLVASSLSLILLMHNALTWLENMMRQNAVVSLVLDKQVSQEQYEQVDSLLKQNPKVASVTKISGPEALEQVTHTLHLSPKLSRDLNLLQLPQILNVQLRKPYLSNMEQLILGLGAHSGINQVLHSKTLVEILDWWYVVLKNLHYLCLSSASIFICWSLSKMIQIHWQHRRDEIMLLYFSGSTSRTICWFFIKEGGILLGTAILLALGFLYGGYCVLERFLFIGKKFPFTEKIYFIPWSDLLVGGMGLIILGMGVLSWQVHSLARSMALR
ncbi:permease-like cell division protein FtsX [Deltaproteobacteria bacterium TL4]